MGYSSTQTRNLVLLAEALAQHGAVTVDAISARALGKGHFFKRLSLGGDCRTATAEQVLEWFDFIWPIDLDWPPAIRRPSARLRYGKDAAPVSNLPKYNAEFIADISHLPIWKNGRRPPWWSDIEVRSFLTDAHRQMSLLEAERRGGKLFGGRCPKKSAIHVYWQRLDVAIKQRPPQSKKKEVA